MTINEDWLTELSNWARGEPSISKAWIFGSRVKGNSNADSDLDIALEIDPEDGNHLSEWIFSARKWRDDAQQAVGDQVRIDLQWANEADDEIVSPAVKDHGIMFYERES